MRRYLTLFIFLTLGICAIHWLRYSSQIRYSPKQVSKQINGKPLALVNLAIWSNFVLPETLQNFEEETGIHVQVSYYSSNEELLAKLQAGAGGYDLIVPTDYMVDTLLKLDLLLPLVQSKIPHIRSIDSHFFLAGVDPEGKYAIPFDWGTTGIGVNRALLSGILETNPLRGWRDLFTNPKFFGKYMLLDDAHEVIGAALKAEGFSLNSIVPEELKKAKDLLLSARRGIRAFNSEPMMPLLDRETPIAQVYTGDALQARRDSDGTIDFILPEEGGVLWTDLLAVPRGALHLEEAFQLMNFLLNPKMMAQTTERLFLAPTSVEAFGFLSPELRSDHQLFPPAEIFSRFEMLRNLGASSLLYDRIWTEIKATLD